MPALPNRVLRAKLAGALPEGTVIETGAEDVHPAMATVPGFGRVRLYLWTVTADRSATGRPAGEHKIQLILPGQPKKRGSKASLEMGDGAFTALLGYSADFGVFVGWEAPLYQDFAYSPNVQCREELLREARDTGWAVAPPRTLKRAAAEEVRVAFTPGNLAHFLRLSRSADNEGVRGRWREAYFLARTPNVKAPALPKVAKELETYVEKERQRVVATRLLRDATFGPRVKDEYDHACAVCAVQLEIVEGAHIIPVRQAGSSDDVWNGVSLCPNHHELFDGSAFVVTVDLIVRVDDERVDYLRENDRGGGIEILTDHSGHEIRRPHFWDTNAAQRERMQGALQQRVRAAGLA